VTPEGQVKKDIQDYLTGTGMFWRRLQSGKVAVKRGWMQLNPIGTYDFLVCPRKGFAIGWIETKQLKGKLRPEQVEFRDMVSELGHPTVTAESVDDVEKWLKENGAL